MEALTQWGFVIALTGLMCTTSGEVDEDTFQRLLSRVESLEKDNLVFRREFIESNIKYETQIAEMEAKTNLLKEKLIELQSTKQTSTFRAKDINGNTKDEVQHLDQTITDIATPINKEHAHDKRLLFNSNGGIVAFTAVLTPVRVLHFSKRQTIIFDKVLTNIGGGYNPDNGTFVAPVKGLYIISCSLLDDMAVDTMLHADIVVNNVVKARVFAHSEIHKYRDQGAQTIFIEINQGDIVRIRHIDENDGVVGGELFSSFSGYLLWPME